MTRQRGSSLHRVVGSQGGEGYTLLMSRLTEQNGNAPGAIYCHGSASDNTSVVFHPPALELAMRGFIVMGIDAGGTNTFGNDASLTSLSTAKTWLQSTGMAASGGIVVLGGSMGSIVALNWARANPSSVLCVEVALPIADVEAVRAADRGGFQSEIETAYTNNAGWQTARPTHNPIEYAADISGIPIRLDVSSDDSVGSASEAQDFADEHGNTTLVVFGAAGHSYTGFTGIDPADWIEANI